MIARLRLLVVALLHEAIRALRPMPPLTQRELHVLRALAGHTVDAEPLTPEEFGLIVASLQTRGLVAVDDLFGSTLTRAGRAVLGVS